jgi:hypothetical protein
MWPTYRPPMWQRLFWIYPITELDRKLQLNNNHLVIFEFPKTLENSPRMRNMTQSSSALAHFCGRWRFNQGLKTHAMPTRYHHRPQNLPFQLKHSRGADPHSHFQIIFPRPNLLYGDGENINHWRTEPCSVSFRCPIVHEWRISNHFRKTQGSAFFQDIHRRVRASSPIHKNHLFASARS